MVQERESRAEFEVTICGLKKISAEKFGGSRNSSYLCNAKMIERYEEMPPQDGGIYSICHRIGRPIRTVTASGSPKAPVARSISHSDA